MKSAAGNARALLDATLRRCADEHLTVGDVAERDWSVEAEVRSGPEKVKIVVWFNAKGQLTPRVQGKEGPLKTVVEQALHEDTPTESAFFAVTVQEWIGVDESGKGDYFGPLVTAGVLVTPAAREQLKPLVIRDSKTLNDRMIARTAARIRDICGDAVTVVMTMPPRYNEIVGTKLNSGKSQSLLAWQHARAIENLLEKHPSVAHAICDKFADESVVRRALMERGKTIDLRQHHRAEQDMAVAAASIVARDVFVQRLRSLSEQAGCDLPMGASREDEIRRAVQHIVRNEGTAALGRYAKLHFRTTEKMLRSRG